MIVFVSSDWHFQPVPAVSDADYHQKKEELDGKLNRVGPHLDFLETQLDAGHGVVLAGDLLDTLEFVQEAYEGHPVLTRLREWTEKYPETLHILEGNHDRIISKNAEFLRAKPEVDITNILFRHGDQYDMLWSWFRPSRAPGCFRKLYRTPAKRKQREKKKAN